MAITTAALLSATLLLGTVISTWQAIRATGAEGLARTRLQAETEARNATREQLLLTEQAEDQAIRRPGTHQGQADVGLQQWDKAIAEYTSALELLPNHALTHNNLVWLLATCPDPKFRDPTAAVEHSTRAVELKPNAVNAWNTLGTAHYRTGNGHAAIESLEKAEQLSPGEYFGDNAFFLAMAHWQLGSTGVGDQGSTVRDQRLTAEEQARHKDEARKWYDQAIEWMEKIKPNDEELKRFRAEAAELVKQGSGQ